MMSAWEALKQKTEVFLMAKGQFKGYQISYKGLSMEEMLL